MLQTDTTEVKHHQNAGVPIIEDRQEELPHHPYKVLHELPRDATPAQQDSVLQAVYSTPYTKKAAPIDSLSLLNRCNIKNNLEKVDLPQYYRQNFFSTDSLWHPELNGGRMGIAGDPVPYTIREDNVITALLIGCFVLAFVALSKSRWFIMRQAKSFFRVQRSKTTEISETTNEFRFQFFLVTLTCLLLSLVTFFYAQECNSDTFLVSSQYQLIAMFFGVFAGYFTFKALLYSFVNWVFFDKRQNGNWMRSYLFMTAVEGVVMFPMVVSQAYFGLSLKNTLVYVGFVVFLTRILSLYKSFLIFFRHKGGIVQIILYFCALEMMPLLTLCGVLSVLISYLNINF